MRDIITNLGLIALAGFFQSARDDAVSSATRIAVKYVEVVNEKDAQE